MKKQLKRLTIPRSWSLPKKRHKWATKAQPGPHSQETSLPLVIIIRDYLKLCDTASEAKKILANRSILVDQKVVTKAKFPVGFMDVISIPRMNTHYRLMLNKNGKLVLVKTDLANSRWKLVRIENKVNVKGGKFQLNLHDGRNILLEKNAYSTNDILKIELPSQKIIGHHVMAEGSLAILTGGAHQGDVLKIEEIEIRKSTNPNMVHFEDGISTILDYVFVVGKTKPEVTIPEVSVI